MNMRTIQVLCNVPLAVAVNAGRARYGIAAVALTDEDIAALSNGARALLANAYEQTQVDCKGLAVKSLNNCFDAVDVDAATPEAARVALEVLATRREEKAKTEAAKHEDDVRKALAAPDEAWVYTSSCNDRPPALADGDYADIGGVFFKDIRGDERIQARMRDIKERVLPPLVEAWRVKKAEGEALAAAALAKEAEAKATWAAKVRAYVIACVPNYKRAAEDGRDVTRVGEKAAAEVLDDWISAPFNDGIVRAGSEGRDLITLIVEWDGREKREVPSSYAYAVLDVLKAVVAEKVEAAPPELRTLLGTPEFSIDRLTGEDDDWELTAAVVDIPLGARVVRVAVKAE